MMKRRNSSEGGWNSSSFEFVITELWNVTVAYISKNEGAEEGGGRGKGGGERKSC